MSFSAKKDIFVILLSVASRGSFKLGVTIFTVALFTGVITATQNIAASYAINSPIIKQISNPPLLTVHREDYGGMLKVEAGSTLVNASLVMVVSPSNITEYLNIMNVRSDSIQLRLKEALVSVELLSLTVNGTIEVEGVPLSVCGVLRSSTKLSKTMVVSPETLKAISIEITCLYFQRLSGVESTGIAEAPSSINLINGMTAEIQSALFAITYSLYAVLALTCLVQALHALNESKDVLKVFSVLGSSRRGLCFSLVCMAALVSVVSVILGYAIGVVASGSASAILSLSLGVPYMKPSLSNALLSDLTFAFVSCLVALSVGYVRGCMLAYSDQDT